MLKGLKARSSTAIPKALLLWISFLILRKINSSFVILAFFVPIFYGVYSNKVFSPKEFIKSSILYCILGVLGVLALQNLYLVIILNLIVTFSLCYYFCTDLSPNGYILYLLEFVFIQMRSFSVSDIPMLLLVLILMFLILFVILVTKNHLFKTNKKNPNSYKNTFKEISEFLSGLSQNSEDIIEKNFKLDSKIDGFYCNYYSSSIFPSNISLKNYLDYYMIIIMIRIKVLSKILRENSDENNKNKIIELSKLFENCSNNINRNDNVKLLNEINFIKSSYLNNKSNINKHIIAILNSLEKIISKIDGNKKIYDKPLFSGITLAKSYIKIHGFKNYLEINRFRLAFAMRMTLLATLTWVLRYLIDNPYSYWLPLNTILFIKPAYEESKNLSLNRMLGNAIGCTIVFLILHFFPFEWFPMTLFFLCSIIYHLWVPKKWSSYIWSSIYGTAIITYKLDVNVAVPLKLSFILSGFILALLANRFVFTKPKKTVFINNFRGISILLRDELKLILKSSYDTKNIASIIYLKMQLHFTERQMLQYSDGDFLNKDNSMVSYKILNEISSNIENIFFLIITIDNRINYISSIETLEKSFDILINQNYSDLLKNLNLLNEIKLKTTNILIDLQEENYSKDVFPLIE